MPVRNGRRVFENFAFVKRMFLLLLLLRLRAFDALLFHDLGELGGELVVGSGELLLEGRRSLGGELGLGVLDVLVGVAELRGDVVLPLLVAELLLARPSDVQN